MSNARAPSVDGPKNRADSHILSSDTTSKTLLRRYVIAVAIILCLVTGSHFASVRVLSVQQDSATSINISGRQRMLSQRIQFKVSQLINASSDYEKTHAQLTEVVDLFEQSHLALTQGGDLGMNGKLSPELETLYFSDGPEGGLDALSRQFIDLSRSFLSADQNTSVLAWMTLQTTDTELLLQKLDEAVHLFEDAAAQGVVRVSRIADLSFYLAIVVLMFEICFIFWPAHKLVKRSLRDAEEKNFALETSHKKVRAEHQKAERARAEAEEALEAKSRFLANMSHEIRTPMNGIIGTAELMASTPLTVDQKENLRLINTSAASLLHIINDILDYSKLDAGHMELQNQRFCLHDLIYDVVSLLAPSARKKKLELCVDYPASVPMWVEGDEMRLRQCLLNVVGNGIKFTDEGYVLIELQMTTDGTTEISVKDTGIGMSSEQLPRVFAAFEQADLRADRRYMGTGLGMAITQRLLTMMKGEISVTSQQGKGSRFTLSLPLTVVDHPDEKADTLPTAFSGQHILIADNQSLTLRILENQLKNLGFKVTAVNDMSAAIDMLSSSEAKNIELAIIDTALPEITVSELVEQMRAGPNGQSIALLLLSNDPSDATHEGVAGIVPKPVKSTTLLRALALSIGSEFEPQPDSKPALSSELDAAFKNLRVMVADDSATNQLVLTKFLTRFGIKSENYDDGESIVLAAIANPPDLILMDMYMPYKDGIAATAEIREAEVKAGLAPCPIVMVTANTLPEDKVKCLEAGANDLITKPISHDALAQMLNRWTQSTKDIQSSQAG